MKNLAIIFFLPLLLLCINSCSKDTIYEEFELPMSEIQSIEKISESEYRVKVYINKGVGAILKEKYLVLENITDSEKSFKQELQFENDDKECEIGVIVTLTNKHDYKIQTILQSEKNEYKSKQVYLYLSENYQQNGFIDVEFPYLGDFFRDVLNGIGYISNLNDGVHLYFNYEWLPTKAIPVKVKVDGKTLLEDFLTFDKWIFDNSHNMYFVSVYVEFKDINTGDHSVYIILDNKEYVMREKVRILEGNIDYSNFISAPKKWETTNSDVDMSYFYSNKLFYFLAKGEAKYDIISCDLKDLSWNKNGSITLYGESSYFSGSNINIGENLYSLAWRDSMYYIEGEIWPKLVKVLDIWKYNMGDNSFVKETKYPGKAIYDLLFFSDNENIYIGGGYTYEQNVEGKFDFWCYNLNTKKWTKKNDTPISFNTSQSTSNFLIDNKIYIFTGYRELWRYVPVSDRWEKESTMHGGSYYRDKSTLLYLNNDLYVIGGTSVPWENIYYEDVWRYNMETKTWTLKTFFDLGYYRYPAFIFNNKIYSTNHDIFGTFKYVEIQ